jgi:hypothetical protein
MYNMEDTRSLAFASAVCSHSYTRIAAMSQYAFANAAGLLLTQSGACLAG